MIALSSRFDPCRSLDSHRAMLSYLHNAGMSSTYASLRQESNIEDFQADDPKAKWVGLLEKKWTSVIRLQKKVCRTHSKPGNALI